MDTVTNITLPAILPNTKTSSRFFHRIHSNKFVTELSVHHTLSMLFHHTVKHMALSWLTVANTRLSATNAQNVQLSRSWRYTHILCSSILKRVNCRKCCVNFCWYNLQKILIHMIVCTEITQCTLAFRRDLTSNQGRLYTTNVS